MKTDMTYQLRKAIAMEEKAQQFLLELKEQIVSDVNAAGPMSEVQIPDLPVTCAVVNLSSLYRHSLAPSTYIPPVQANAVKRKLAPKQTVQGVLESLREMIETQSVRFSDKEHVLLNRNTIAALTPWQST